MVRKLVWICVALLIAASSYAYCNWPILSDPEPEVPRWKWDDNLGNGIVGQLAFAVSEGRGMELAREWGFEPEREISVSSTADLGDFERFAPTGINKLGWNGTAYIQGWFEGHPENLEYMPGILVYQLDSGPVIWIHATEAWLDQREHRGMWRIQQDDFGYMGVGEEIRAIILRNVTPGDDIDVRGPRFSGMKGTVGSVILRLIWPQGGGAVKDYIRYDIVLKRSRVKELQAQWPLPPAKTPSVD